MKNILKLYKNITNGGTRPLEQVVKLSEGAKRLEVTDSKRLLRVDFIDPIKSADGFYQVATANKDFVLLPAELNERYPDMQRVIPAEGKMTVVPVSATVKGRIQAPTPEHVAADILVKFGWFQSEKPVEALSFINLDYLLEFCKLVVKYPLGELKMYFTGPNYPVKFVLECTGMVMTYVVMPMAY